MCKKTFCLLAIFGNVCNKKYKYFHTKRFNLHVSYIATLLVIVCNQQVGTNMTRYIRDVTRGTRQTVAIVPGHAIETESLPEAGDLCFKVLFSIKLMEKSRPLSNLRKTL